MALGRKTGSIYLSILFTAIFACPTATTWAKSGPKKPGAAILPPEIPKRPPPRGVTPEQMEQDLERLRNRRRQREVKSPSYRQNKRKNLQQQFDDIAKKPGPMQLFMKASFAANHIVTSGNKRTNYLANPSVYFHTYIKPFAHQAFDSYEFWTGFRLAPLSGTGEYQKTAGRFGWTYFGPMFGLGTVSPATFSLGAYEESLGTADRSKDFDRDAFFWMSGIAILSRSGFVEKGRDKPEDFNSEGAALDGTGIWTEITAATIYYNRLSTSYSLGIQLGQGKQLFYLSFDLGFWH